MRLTSILYLVRHGETDWNAERRYQGQMDIPLNARGRQQAMRNGEVLARHLSEHGYDPSGLVFVSSPLGRARETMELLRAGLGLPAKGYLVDDRLKEASYGVWEGLTVPEIEARDPTAFSRRQADPGGFAPAGGESYDALGARVRPIVEALHRDTLIVAHGGVMKVVRGMLEVLTPAQVLSLDAPQDQVLAASDLGTMWI